MPFLIVVEKVFFFFKGFLKNSFLDDDDDDLKDKIQIKIDNLKKNFFNSERLLKKMLVFEQLLQKMLEFVPKIRLDFDQLNSFYSQASYDKKNLIEKKNFNHNLSSFEFCDSTIKYEYDQKDKDIVLYFLKNQEISFGRVPNEIFEGYVCKHLARDNFQYHQYAYYKKNQPNGVGLQIFYKKISINLKSFYDISNNKIKDYYKLRDDMKKFFSEFRIFFEEIGNTDGIISNGLSDKISKSLQIFVNYKGFIFCDFDNFLYTSYENKGCFYYSQDEGNQ